MGVFRGRELLEAYATGGDVPIFGLGVLGGEPECESAIRDYEKASKLAKTEEQERDINKKIRSAQIQLKRAKRKDFYKILGVSLDATDAEIKKACEYHLF